MCLYSFPAYFFIYSSPHARIYAYVHYAYNRVRVHIHVHVHIDIIYTRIHTRLSIDNHYLSFFLSLSLTFYFSSKPLCAYARVWALIYTVLSLLLRIIALALPFNVLSRYESFILLYILVFHYFSLKTTLINLYPLFIG